MRMKTIQKDRLQNMEHFQYADRVLKLCKEAGIEKLTDVLAPLEAALAKEDEALNRSRSLDGTEALEKLDRKRDNAYYALRLLVEMELRNDDENVVEAAKTVAEVMRRYPKTPEVNYDQETGNIRNMVDDFKKAPAAAAVTKINATAAIARLDAANKAFDARYHQRITSKTPKGTFDTAALRMGVDKALESVLAHITALDTLSPDAKTTALITHYNNLVDLYQDVLARRKAANAKKNKEKKKKGDKDKKPSDGDKKPGDGKDKKPSEGDKKPGDGGKKPDGGGKKPGNDGKKPDDGGGKNPGDGGGAGPIPSDPLPMVPKD